MEPRESSFGKEQAEDDHLEPHNNHKGSPASTDQQDTNQAPREKDSQPEDHATDQAPQEQGSTSKQKDES
jgi:hypothetical protein